MRFADVKPFQVFRRDNITCLKLSATTSVESRTGKDVVLSLHDKVTLLDKVKPRVCPIDYAYTEHKKEASHA